MTNIYSNNKPMVVFWSAPTGLAVNLVERLLMNYCRVKIVNDDIELWKNKLEYLPNKEALTLLNTKEIFNIENTEYLLINDYDLNNGLGVLESLFVLAKERFLKSMILFPYQTTEQNFKDNLNKKLLLLKKTIPDMGVIYLGDLLGPKIDYSEVNFAGSLVLDAINKGEIKESFDETSFFISPILESSKEIVRALFSFGATSEGLAVLGCQVETSRFNEYLKNSFPQSVLKNEVVRVRREAPVEEIKNLGTSVESLMKQTFDWFAEHPAPAVKEIKKAENLKRIDTPKEKVNKKVIKEKKPGVIKLKKYLKTLVFIAVSIFVIPLITLLVGAASLTLAFKGMEKGSVTNAKTWLGVSLVSSNMASYEYQVLAKPPVISYLFSPFLNYAAINNRAAKIAQNTVDIFEKAEYLGENLLKGEDFALNETVRELTLNLGNLYDESGFIEGELKSLSKREQGIINHFFNINKISDLRNKLLYAKEVVSQLPDLVGVEKQKTYLFLFQNNMELRPTGGFIGSFALVTFDNGKISDFNVQDVYSADGQLKGHIEPPEPIKRYLGEASWFLRDSNWDPDFPTSATRAEWFLDKEIDKSVDGVIGIDLELVKNILKVTGPLKLTDFGFEITEKNLYQKTQSEVEENFFPGSTKKSTLLTAISRELIQRLLNLNKDEFPPVASMFFKALEERDIQILFHNKMAQKGISNLGYDGAVLEPNCLGNCFADWFGVIDANLGVNKANLFLKRSFNLSLKLEKTNLVKTLSINFKNTADTALGIKGRYKTYVRLLLPLAAQAKEVIIASGQENTVMPLDIIETQGRKEVGFALEILPSSEKTAEITWTQNKLLNFSQTGEYRLYWRKQAGTNGDAAEITIQGFPKRVKYSLPFTLTGDGQYRYNTTLARDLFPRISW